MPIVFHNLVGGFNPSQKYESNWIMSPSRGKSKHIRNHQPSNMNMVNIFSRSQNSFHQGLINAHV